MSCAMLDKFLSSIVNEDDFVKQTNDCVGKTGISARVKEAAVLRTLAVGLPLDTVDEYLSMLETTVQVTMK